MKIIIFRYQFGRKEYINNWNKKYAGLAFPKNPRVVEKGESGGGRLIQDANTPKKPYYRMILTIMGKSSSKGGGRFFLEYK